jgi:hypothetical protein
MAIVDTSRDCFLGTRVTSVGCTTTIARSIIDGEVAKLVVITPKRPVLIPQHVSTYRLVARREGGSAEAIGGP